MAPASGTPPVLSDGVIVLRLLTPHDADDITEGCHDPLTVQFTTVPSPYAREDAVHFIAESLAPEAWWAAPRWAITLPEISGDRWGGTIDLRLDDDGGAEVGYQVAPWLRRHGVATRALRLACRWGFSSLGLQVVTWHAYVGNDASRAVAEAAGFRVLSEPVRRGLSQRGQRVDAWIGTLLPEDLDSARRRSTGPALTKREREVLDLVASGLSNRDIAGTLRISENTVKNHVARLLEKLQARSRMEAVVRGVQLGLTRVR
jgi:RimJ/RimL family protein N-acetyltransferase/DNA-binding CsgD family transcriptional regulator